MNVYFLAEFWENVYFYSYFQTKKIKKLVFGEKAFLDQKVKKIMIFLRNKNENVHFTQNLAEK